MDSFLKRGDEILSVAEFSRRFKMLVKTGVPQLWLRGEVSNMRRYPSGHVYFTLKDAEASVSAVLFKGSAPAAQGALKDGARLLVYGEVGIYEARGSYQIVVKAVLDDGVGELAKRFETLKEKLSAEGLFDAARKREIPKMPRRIAVVTSPSGAAVRDFISILRRRFWTGEVAVLPSKVQGAEAAAEIVSQIERANALGIFDLLIVMRGGGSLEDLWPFNEEAVARAISASELPTISAVGHEIDFTLSDFAADWRAETPSAAAELVSSARMELEERLRLAWNALRSFVAARVEELRGRVALGSHALIALSPGRKIENLEMRLDEISARLDSSAAEGLRAAHDALHEAALGMERVAPARRLEMLFQRLKLLGGRLEGLGFQAVLRRGFAIVEAEDGRQVMSAKKIRKSENYRIHFSDGHADVMGK